MTNVTALLLLLFLAIPQLAGAQFNRNLYFGMRRDPEVVRLQDFLRTQGFFSYPFSTGNFFSDTLQAVRRFQQSQNIVPASGYFGPFSRVAANRLLGRKPGLVSVSPPSVYKGKIQLEVWGYHSDPRFESALLFNLSDKENIVITGFSLENSRGEKFAIPQGHELPGFAASAADQISLRPGDRAHIAVGTNESRRDFRLNACTGYFAEFTSFNPPLDGFCPRADTRDLTHLKDACLGLIDATPTCRTPRPVGVLIDSACSEYLQENLNYAGCVRNYRHRENFFGQEWRIWMQRTEEFFKNTHDKIILRDQQGRVVAEYGY